MMRALACAFVLVCIAVGSAHAGPPHWEFDLSNCLEFANRFNRSGCVACNVVFTLWCESASFHDLCGGESPPSPCAVCTEGDSTAFTRNAQAAMHIIRHDCEACEIYRQRNDVMAERAVAHMNKRVEKSEETDCGSLCLLVDCITASADPAFGGEAALQCRSAIKTKCAPPPV